MTYTIENAYLICEISSVGAEVISVKSKENGKEYMWNADSYWYSHFPLLFPFAGYVSEPYHYRGKEYYAKKHGFINSTVFDAKKLTDNDIVFTTKENDETLKAYPFAFEFSARYYLVGKSLFAEFKVKNPSDEVMPYMLGLHPGFVLIGNAPKEEYIIDFHKEINVLQHPIAPPYVSSETFERNIQNGKLSIQNEIYEKGTLVFENAGTSVSLLAPEGKLLDVSFSENFKYLCIWKSSNDDARFICIEPWTNVSTSKGGIDDLDTKDMTRLSAGGENIHTARFDFC